ncbi:hypothetical protein [Pontibacter burrus]|uniref:Uncharacterized protein n=1 Tax=Pontibacter burrus TaxID=2704466 RepID=A0A6B3LN39_9BACT|nr:hypothetical protein [Pontibacter burrus]NEM97303.1 hypothetical protein [Pontibacter burrus]
MAYLPPNMERGRMVHSIFLVGTFSGRHPKPRPLQPVQALIMQGACIVLAQPEAQTEL